MNDREIYIFERGEKGETSFVFGSFKEGVSPLFKLLVGSWIHVYICFFLVRIGDDCNENTFLILFDVKSFQIKQKLNKKKSFMREFLVYNT